MKLGSLSLFRSDKSRAIKDAREVLEQAIGNEFEAVVIVGVKNGCASTCKSKSLDTLELIGAIELAKHSIFQKWPSRTA
jgi:hypothetical protein